PAREVEERVGREHEAGGGEHACEALAGCYASAQGRQLGPERALEQATVAGGEEDARLLEQLAQRRDPVGERLGRAVALGRRRPALRGGAPRAGRVGIARLDHAAGGGRGAGEGYA